MPVPHAQPNNVDVAVVGAGVCGLITAVALRQRGLTCRVIEARDRIGGRVVGVPGHAAVDLGPAWYWPHHHHVRRLLDDLGLASFVQPSDGTTVVDAGPGRASQRYALPESGPAPFRVVGGITALVDALARELDASTVKLSSPVERIELAGNQVLVTAKGSEVESSVLSASACIVAIPPALAARTLALDPPLDAHQARLMDATPTWMSWSMKVALVYETATWQRAGPSGDGISRIGPVLQFYDATEPSGLAEKGPGVLVGWMEPRQVGSLSKEERREQTIAQASRMFRLPEPMVYAEADWSAEPYTTVSQEPPLGSPDLFGADGLREAMWGERLHFAGSETSEESPGYLDGAIARGRQVADTVVARLKELGAVD